MRSLIAAALVSCLPRAWADPPRSDGKTAAATIIEYNILVQDSRLAGFSHYGGKAAWPELRVGDPLTLVREPDNPFDSQAVRVEWRGVKLGYVPRAENSALARMLDRREPVEARISRLTQYRNHRKRFDFEIFLPL